ncbi:hypothetical protein MMC21_005315 [Puttea exsequens]|nr:hypothetical protein [Puttea exsequens]
MYASGRKAGANSNHTARASRSPYRSADLDNPPSQGTFHLYDRYKAVHPNEKNKNTQDNLPKESHRPQSPWLQVMHSGLERHRRNRRHIQDRVGSSPHQIAKQSAYEMNLDDVLLGIATFWNALRVNGVLYAYASSDIFDSKGDAKAIAMGIMPGAQE